MRGTGRHAAVALILLLAILSFSGTGFWFFGFSGHAVMAALSVAGALWLIRSGWRDVSGKPVRPARIVFFSGSAVLLGLLAVYYFNPTHRWPEGLGAVPVRHCEFLPGSAFPQGTLQSLCFSALALMAGGLAMNLGRKEVKLFSAVAVLVAAVTALAVLGQRLTPRPYPVFEFTGFFTYENHFAAFANLILPVALCAAARQRVNAFQTGRISSPAGLLLLAALIIGAAVAVSRSRAGLAISGLIVVSFVVWQFRLQRRYPFVIPPASLLTKISLGAGTVAAAGVVLIKVIRESGNWARISQEFGFRGQVMADILSMWKSHPWWGTGPGSFAAVFPYYQSVPVDKHFFAHAHCEPLEFLTEYGLLGGAVFLTVLAGLLLFGRRRDTQSHGRPSFAELEGFGLLLALCGVGLHSLTDFPLRHPLNALITWVWTGILVSRVNGFSAMKFLRSRNSSRDPDGESA
jgi:O-antigen ligase